MISKNIPAPVIAILSEKISELTHKEIDNLFLHADAPGDPPEEAKLSKTQAWLRRINKESANPLEVLGKLVEPFMESTDYDSIKEFQEKLIFKLQEYGLQYRQGGIISDAGTLPSKTLTEKIHNGDYESVKHEFECALINIHTAPREAVSAASNIFESLFKIYIETKKLSEPSKKDLQSVWKIVREDLGFDPGSIEDNDLKKVLSGIISIIDGIGAFRTHASAAHGHGVRKYTIKPRDAQLVVNAAHTLVLYIWETWEGQKSKIDDKQSPV